MTFDGEPDIGMVLQKRGISLKDRNLIRFDIGLVEVEVDFFDVLPEQLAFIHRWSLRWRRRRWRWWRWNVDCDARGVGCRPAGPHGCCLIGYRRSRHQGPGNRLRGRVHFRLGLKPC